MINLPNFCKRYLVFVCLLSTSLCAKSQSWPWDESDLKPDQSIKYGTLPNGFQYVLFPNSEPPEKLSLQLLVKAGSLHEAPEQRGIAHFVEHMAFNGSTNYPPGQLIELLQKMGMAFGKDTNAHVSFDETVYKLELPDNQSKTIFEGLRVFRDYADQLLFLPEEIERERGVIINEKNARDSVYYRTFQATAKYLYAGTLFPERMPIGIESVIQNASSEVFRNYYSKWYVANNMCLVVVGDFNYQEIVQQITDRFSSLKSAPKKLVDPLVGMPPLRPSSAFYHYENEATETEITLLSITPNVNPSDNLSQRLKKMEIQLGNQIIKKRLDRRKKELGSTLLNTSAYHYNFINQFDLTVLEATCQKDQWKETLKVLQDEWARAYEFGFLASELEEARANMINRMEQAVASASTRKNRSLVRSLVHNLSHKRVPMHPQDLLNKVRPHLNSLDQEKVFASWKESWNPRSREILLTGNTHLDEKNPSNNILAEYRANQKATIEPPEKIASVRFAYESNPQNKAKIISRIHHDDLDIHQIVFENQVRLNLKSTEFDKDSVQVLVQFGGGKLEETPELAGISMVASNVFIKGGLVAHDIDTLETLNAGRTLDYRFDVNEDHFTLYGNSNRADTVRLLEVIQAYLEEPSFRPVALQLFHKELPSRYKKWATTLYGVMRSKLKAQLAPDNFRFAIPSQEMVTSYSLDQVKNWLHKSLTESFLEISIVGDFDVENMITQVAQTLGKLNSRKSVPEAYSYQRIATFPTDQKKISINYPSSLPKSYAGVYWKGIDDKDVFLNRRLSVLSRVLGDRLRKTVREKYGDAYSTYAMTMCSETFLNYGYLSGVSFVTPGTGQRVNQLILKEAADLYQNGCQAEEFERIINPINSSMKTYLRKNKYWLQQVLSRCQQFPEKFFKSRTIIEDYLRISHSEINKLAKVYLFPEKAVLVEINPEVTDSNSIQSID